MPDENSNSEFWKMSLGEGVLSLILTMFTPGLLFLSGSMLSDLSQVIGELTDLNNIGTHTYITYFIIWAIIWMCLHEIKKKFKEK